jgi:hypothetical protein
MRILIYLDVKIVSDKLFGSIKLKWFDYITLCVEISIKMTKKDQIIIKNYDS